MIVATFPRTGATKFCVDLAKKHNMPFVGELSPMYIPEIGENGYWDKKTRHEVPNCQPQPTLQMFNKYLDTKDCVKQVNRHAYLILDKADYILLRRDFQHCAESLVGIIKKMAQPGNEQILNIVIGTKLKEVFSEVAVLTAWCLDHPERKITWFEDYFPKFDEWSENHKEKNLTIDPGLLQWIKYHIKQTPIQKNLDLLWNRTH
jgi:hypothetical protein